MKDKEVHDKLEDTPELNTLRGIFFNDRIRRVLCREITYMYIEETRLYSILYIPLQKKSKKVAQFMKM